MLESIQTVSPRVIDTILKPNKRNCIKFTQVYAATTNHTDDEVDLLYDDVNVAWENHKIQFIFLYDNFNLNVGLMSDETALGKKVFESGQGEVRNKQTRSTNNNNTIRDSLLLKSFLQVVTIVYKGKNSTNLKIERRHIIENSEKSLGYKLFPKVD